jgi:hypothetical protein
MPRILPVVLLPCLAPALSALCLAPPSAEPREARALRYLTQEVPRWAADNKCYSCHNNGDGARALYTALRRGHEVPARALADTTHWLAQPERWDDNGGKAGFSDKGLARIQFAAALATAVDAGPITDRTLLARAATLVAAGQRPDGSWQVDADGAIGSPATYGACLATTQACSVLRKADDPRFTPAVHRADAWLRRVPVKSVLDAAAALLGLGTATDAEATRQRLACQALIERGESKQGGWGPTVHSPSEPFDTALVMLAIAQTPGFPQAGTRLQRGRAYLLTTQRPDGSWPETTRPPGADSYAQRLSTTAWATLALLATEPSARDRKRHPP